MLVKIKKGIKLECRLRCKLIHADVDRRYLTTAHNKPNHLSPLLINLCLLSKTGCHTDFLLFLFQHAGGEGEARGESRRDAK